MLTLRLPEGLDGEAETVMQLRSELREKEMKLTDIRLEALSSAHQLDQLREAMNRMQVKRFPIRICLKCLSGVFWGRKICSMKFSQKCEMCVTRNVCVCLCVSVNLYSLRLRS